MNASAGNVPDSIIRALAELDPLFSDFKAGEAAERSILLVARTPEEKQKLAEELAKSEEFAKPASDFRAKINVRKR